MKWTVDLERLLLELRFKDTLVQRAFDKIKNNADRSNAWSFFARRFNEIAQEEENRSYWCDGVEPFDLTPDKLKDKIGAI